MWRHVSCFYSVLSQWYSHQCHAWLLSYIYLLFLCKAKIRRMLPSTPHKEIEKKITPIIASAEEKEGVKICGPHCISLQSFLRWLISNLRCKCKDDWYPWFLERETAKKGNKCMPGLIPTAVVSLNLMLF